MYRPNVKPGDWVTVNKDSLNSFRAVVCSVDFIKANCVEVVFLEFKDLEWKKKPSERRALQTLLIWENDKWTVDSDFYNGYADNFDRLSRFVVNLRKGTWEEYRFM